MNTPLQSLNLEQLQASHDAKLNQLSQISAEIDAINAELQRRYEDIFNAEYANTDKQSGTVSKVLEGVKLECVVRKTVSWDNDLLAEIGEKLPPADARKILDVKISVAEKTFAALPPSIITLLQPARTVRYSAPKISFAK